ncbi:MAG TPA: tRNA (guanosine(37)-N1)-methyltransferase TrmD [Propionibacteriaceae bacterium]
MSGDPLMKIDIVSIFPTYLEPLHLSLVGKAVETGLVELGVHDLRTWTHDRHRTVDDTPYGGGAGMVMKPDPWGEALDELGQEPPAALGTGPRLIVLTPSGRTFTQSVAHELAAERHLIFACGRYEGIDARVVEHAAETLRVDELSIGDYVLNGGEAAALVIIEAVVRLLPGVIGNPASLTEESHSADHEGLLEYPVYTKPPSWRGLDVPEVLFSGHHGKIAAWRRDQAIAKTRERRPDLLPEHLQDLVIRRADAADAGELLTLQRAAYVPEARLNQSTEIPPLLETLTEVDDAVAGELVLVARLDGRLVGSVRGRVESDGAWYVGRLVVAPDRQGRGLGRRLLSEIVSWAPTSAEVCRLWTGAASAANISFYRRQGFVPVRQAVDPAGVPIVVLEKPL